jgi:hypothetical protein
MKQTDLGLNLTTKRTRKREFFVEMERIVPWAALFELILPCAPEEGKWHPPFLLKAILRIYIMHVGTRRLLQSLLYDGERSAHMYTACLVGITSALPAALMRSAHSSLAAVRPDCSADMKYRIPARWLKKRRKTPCWVKNC